MLRRLRRNAHACVHGSITSMPASAKSRTLRVAAAMARERAMAALWQSAFGIGLPIARLSTRSCLLNTFLLAQGTL